MPDQHEWIELKDRTNEIRELVIQVCDLTVGPAKTEEQTYTENNWGLTGNPVLYSALLRMRDEGTIRTHEEIMNERGAYAKEPSGETGVHEDIDDTIRYRRKPESIIAKDISWFMQNGENDEIRLRAREYRERALLDLYLEHVKQSGETYFPQLQQLLESEWRFRISSDEE